MAYVIAAGIPCVPMLVGLAFGIKKDGSPLRKEWWK